MTIAELYNIVKDVPREAWPTNTHFESGYITTDVFNSGGEWERAAIAPPHVELMFIGSMIVWLVEQGHRPDPHIDTPVSYSASWQSPGQRHDCPAPTLLEALADVAERQFGTLRVAGFGDAISDGAVGQHAGNQQFFACEKSHGLVFLNFRLLTWPKAGRKGLST